MTVPSSDAQLSIWRRLQALMFLLTPGKSMAAERHSLSPLRRPTPVVSIQCYLNSTAVTISNHPHCCLGIYQLPENDPTSARSVHDGWVSPVPKFPLKG